MGFKDSFRLALPARPSQAGDSVLFDAATPRLGLMPDVYHAWTIASRQHRAAFVAEWFSFLHGSGPTPDGSAATERDFERVRLAVLERVLEEAAGGPGAA